MSTATKNRKCQTVVDRILSGKKSPGDYKDGYAKKAFKRVGVMYPDIDGAHTMYAAPIPKVAESPRDEPMCEEKVDYMSLSVPALKSLCKERGLKGYSRLKKDDLADLLSDNE